MEYRKLQENWDKFTQLIQKNNSPHDEVTSSLIARYLEQNIEILNDVLMCSIDHLQKLQTTHSANEVICHQARLTNELSKKLMKTAQRFLNASLGTAADYNEWLKTNCDLATD